MVLVQQDPNNIILDVYSKLRILESKNNTLGEHILTVNQNTLEEYKRLNKEISLINEDLKSIKEEVFKLKDAIKTFFGEMEYFAKKADIKVLEKYINLWDPLKFVTEADVEKIVEKKFLKKAGDKTGKRR